MAETVYIYNNLTRKREEFAPIEAGKVKFYSCGPTTYDFTHVGNARAFVTGDIIHRVFKVLGYDVNFVRNFTDVDDKIINRAAEQGVDAIELAAQYVNECITDYESLGMIPATHSPKVTETIPEIITLIESIIENGHGYVVEGEVLFHVPSFKDYGKLSKKDLDSLEHGKRVDVDHHKKHPSDFVLWKPAKEGEPAWDSPWGKGRPGWHIECSAMSKKFLGNHFDLHHGGIDLQFPHHENEIAQSEAANKCTYCNNWVHNEFLNFGTEKMSKSLGNVVTIREFSQKFSGKVLRHILCSVQYRAKMEWSDAVIERAFSEVERIHTFYRDFLANGVGNNEAGLTEIKLMPVEIKKELANDFNLPGALSYFYTMIRLYNREFKESAPSANVHAAIKEVITLVKDATGLIYDNPEDVLDELVKGYANFKKKEDGLTDEAIDELILARKQARADKDWDKADEIRDKLNASGVIVKDNPDGTYSWTYK